ncbi:c-type cytochrome [Parvularcula sp. IMCC14364]|uniref:c-type cytochrome n=1 Tax=Parvularcula sp. IMCC14364 TaxID=3067902 RepID=UPI002741ABA8|nr:cytochrome c [Parvularcula sp. IMCC14364]
MKHELYFATIIAATAFSLSACNPSADPQAPGQPTTSESVPNADAATIVRVAQYEFDAENGRRLFVEEGCVICHSVNGVGGTAAYPLDKETFLSEIDPIHFAARMWRGAPEMIKLQEIELGYQINLNAQEIADLAAFAGNPDEQRKLDISQVPETVRDSFLNDFVWVTAEFPGGVEE